MWRALLLACGACSFSTDLTPMAGDNAPVTADAAVDAPRGPCTIAPTGPPLAGGMIGPGGGSTRPDVVCAAGEVPIGFDFQWEVDAEVIGVHVRCGSLARDAAGTITTTPKERVGDNGSHGTCFFGQRLDAPEQVCPAGEVLVGIQANNVGTSYNSFAMTCQPVTSAIEIAGTKTDYVFPDTGTASANIETAACPLGTAILSFGLKSGCDQEQLVVRCTALACN